MAIRHLHQVKAIAKFKNFGRAAQELNISQPALSRSISTLEKQLGFKLFDRSKQGATPTVFGKYILSRGEQVLQDMFLLERDLNLLHNVDYGELVIGSGPLPAEVILGKAIALFNKNHPNINVKIIIDRSPNLITQLRNREIDLVIADTRVEHKDDLSITSLPHYQGYFCCQTAHPILNKKDLELIDIFEYPIAIMWLPGSILEILSAHSGLSLNSIEDIPKGVIQCDYLKVLFDFIAGSSAIGLITQPILDTYQQQISKLPFIIKELTSHYGIVSLSRYSLPPAVEIFKQCLIEAENQNHTEKSSTPSNLLHN